MKNPELPVRTITEDIAWMAQTHMDILLRLSEYTDDRKGGYLVIADARTGMPIISLMVGQIPKEKYQKYFAFAHEKARRLFESHQKDASIVSSWQTRNPDKDQWGGAVLCKRWIVSFSGLPELVDEAFSASIAASIQVAPMSKALARRIGKISGNSFLEPLLNEALQ